MEDTVSVLVSEKDSAAEKGRLFDGGDGDATSFVSLKSSLLSKKKGSVLSSSTSSHGEAQSGITAQRLRELAVELGIVKLCWPEGSIQQE